MKGIIILILLVSMMSLTYADDQVTITTYYPSPYGVYRNLQLSPTSQPTSGVSRGVMYFNDSQDVIKFYNNTGWQNLTGSGDFWAQNGTNIYNTNSGTVLIGTNSSLPSPSARLAAIGAGIRLGTSTAYTTLTVGSDPPFYRGVSLGWDTSNYIGVIAANSLGSGSQLALWTADSSGIWGERVRLSPNGNFGIGTISPESWAKLDLHKAQLEALHIFTTGVGGLLLGYDGSTIQARSNTDGNNANLILQRWGGNVGIATTSPTYTLTVAGTTWCTSGAWSGSDLRWKENIATLDSPLEKLLRLRGVKFDWKREEFNDNNFPEGRQIGIIAQELEKEFPELVATDGQGNKAIAYDKFTAVLLEAIKAQQQEIGALREELSKLKNTL